MIDTAMLLAAGFGTRMQPLTNNCPKPLIKLAGTSLIDWTLNRLRGDGIKHFVVNTHYLPEKLQSHFAGHADVQLIHEDPILETGGGVKNALSLLGEKPFIIANTDSVIIDQGRTATSKMLSKWNPDEMDFLLLVHPKESAFGYPGLGDYFLSNEGLLDRRLDQPTAPYAFTGTRIVHPRVFENAPDGPFNIRDLFDDASSKNRLAGVVNEGKWYHVDTPAALAEASAIFDELHVTK